jgi:lipase chaperone LimK
MLIISKKLAIIIVLIGTIIVTVFLNQTTEKSDDSDTANNPEHPQLTNEPLTIATQWQWKGANGQLNTAQVSSDRWATLPFTAESIYNALQAVKFDENGDVILDHDALISLDEALERIHNKLDNEMLGILQNLIRQSLKDKGGEQTAKIVGDYYQFLKSKEEFSKMDEALSNANAELTVNSLENDQALYAELQSLREIHLGSDATDSLFRVSDANAQYMFESMKLDVDPNLTPEQKVQMGLEIKAQHVAESINVTDWPARYQAFLTGKLNITTASIDDDEKHQQVAQLLKQHFTHDELKRIKHIGLEAL